VLVASFLKYCSVDEWHLAPQADWSAGWLAGWLAAHSALVRIITLQLVAFSSSAKSIGRAQRERRRRKIDRQRESSKMGPKDTKRETRSKVACSKISSNNLANQFNMDYT